ncbi:MAG TPA: S9 family peptidase [Xanthobacteraceae bacterium]|nr:S9 family peptidase [Xanthobacteraceae bacterium]
MVHGVRLSDEFAWLKAGNWQEITRDPEKLDPAIRAYLQAENDYCERVLADTAPLQAALFAEMKGRIKEDDSTVPDPDGPHAYYLRFRKDGQHPLLCREPRHGGAEQLLLDGDALSQGKPSFQLGVARHSPDHRLLAWLADETGSERYVARVRNIASGIDLADIVPDVSGAVVWTGDATAFYYVRLDQNHRPAGVFRHQLGTPVSVDARVIAAPDPGLFLSVGRHASGRFGEISAHDHETSEVWLVDLSVPDAQPTPVAGRETGVQYEVEHHPAYNGELVLFIRTNADGAEDFKIAWTPLATPGRESWRDLVPHRPGVYVLSFQVLHDWLIRLEREDGLPRIVVRRIASGEEHVIAFPEEAYSLSTSGGLEFATDLLRFSYSSMTTPSEVWDYDLATRARTLRKRQEIPSGHNPANYVTRRLFAPAADGETVPISLLHRKDVVPDGSMPCLLYGYGAYGISIPAAFSANRLSLVDRGFVYAIAHVRGGSEKGWRWYREGKLAKKPNTFSDFIAASEYLIGKGWSAPGRIVAHGGSAGGILIGAVANMRPDLYAGLIAEVPFVDVLNTMLDETLPLTPPEWPEWGDPIRDAAALRTIMAYSPYDNVHEQDYPAILALAGLTDPRVLYWEPAKWIARLRRRRTNRNLIAFRTNLDAGHAGAAGRFDRLKEVALAYAFAIKVAGASYESLSM